jgi:hypothetical protein
MLPVGTKVVVLEQQQDAVHLRALEIGLSKDSVREKLGLSPPGPALEPSDLHVWVREIGFPVFHDIEGVDPLSRRSFESSPERLK